MAEADVKGSRVCCMIFQIMKEMQGACNRGGRRSLPVLVRYLLVRSLCPERGHLAGLSVRMSR